PPSCECKKSALALFDAEDLATAVLDKVHVALHRLAEIGAGTHPFELLLPGAEGFGLGLENDGPESGGDVGEDSRARHLCFGDRLFEHLYERFGLAGLTLKDVPNHQHWRLLS